MKHVKVFLALLLFLSSLIMVTEAPLISAEKTKVGVMWIGKSGMANRVIGGFKDFLAKKAPDIDVEYQVDLADETAALPIYEKFQAEKKAVIFLRSNGVTFLGKHPPQKPTLIGGCTNPTALGLMESLDKPPKNITGVTYYIPAERQISIYLKVFPNLKSLALLVEKGHPSAKIDGTETKAACQKANIAFHEFQCATKEDILAAVQTALDKNIQFLVIGNQALIIDNANIIAEKAGSIPVLSYAEKPVTKHFALCGLVADDDKLGKMMLDSMLQILEDGKAPQQIPVQTDPKPQFTVSLKVMKKLGIEMPESILKYAKKLD